MADISTDTTLLWCTDINDAEGKPLKDTPPDSVKDSGLLRGTPFARVWHNFYFNYLCNSLSWVFEERYAIGAVVSFRDTTEPDFANWRGTWTNSGTTTTTAGTGVSIVIRYYERTA